jgi:hypothetical protein
VNSTNKAVFLINMYDGSAITSLSFLAGQLATNRELESFAWNSGGIVVEEPEEVMTALSCLTPMASGSVRVGPGQVPMITMDTKWSNTRINLLNLTLQVADTTEESDDAGSIPSNQEYVFLTENEMEEPEDANLRLLKDNHRPVDNIRKCALKDYPVCLSLRTAIVDTSTLGTSWACPNFKKICAAHNNRVRLAVGGRRFKPTSADGRVLTASCIAKTYSNKSVPGEILCIVHFKAHNATCFANALLKFCRILHHCARGYPYTEEIPGLYIETTKSEKAKAVLESFRI